jgi:hypothetical protein
MPETEAARLETIAVCSAHRLAPSIPRCVGVRCERCHQGMKHITQEGNG